MIHVTANEAGRNAVIQTRLLRGLDELINAINSGATPHELTICVRTLEHYIVKTMKIRPTV